MSTRPAASLPLPFSWPSGALRAPVLHATAAMIEPTPRQQAGYLRRLLRRGAIAVIDPHSGVPVPTAVELNGDVVQLLPTRGASTAIDPAEQRWLFLLERLRKAMSLSEAEELASAVETERSRADQTPERSYIPQST
jgi:virulence-associated protein VagC